MANVLVLGSGAREHCIAWKLSQSPLVKTIHIAPGNSCEFSISKELLDDANDLEKVRVFCQQNAISLVILGPEKPICDGWADELAAICPVFAPSKAAARLEGSKTFAKEFMIRHSLPTARYRAFSEEKAAIEFVQNAEWQPPFVIKEDGLCAGKGVHICSSVQEATLQLAAIYATTPNASVVVEEHLWGYEVSALAFTDGTAVRPLPLSQDHKKVGEGDRGPNTGGMGAIAPVFVPRAVEREIHSLLQKTVDGMREDGHEYRGVLYAGLMITKDGPRILEFNCRFGDPETEAIFPLLRDVDLYAVCRACANGRLSELAPESSHFIDASHGRAACIVLASKGYPNGSLQLGVPLELPRPIGREHVDLPCGCEEDERRWGFQTSGGRILSVSSVTHSYFQSVANCTETIGRIKAAGAFFRRDIGNFVLARNQHVDYAQSGVNIDEGNRLIDEIKEACAATLLPGTDKIGGFGAIVDLEQLGFEKPQLVLGMDGVGSKIELASQANRFDSLGFDLVGMCANDVLCHGARPVAFLDYYVTGRLDRRQAAEVIKSVAKACGESGCALVGGETAEMPGVYNADQWDLAGCCVGAKEAAAPTLPDLESIGTGDVLIGLASNGLHSNGFSLVRKTMSNYGLSINDECPWDSKLNFAEELLRPTRLYAKALIPLIEKRKIAALAHITGGGLVENVPRVLPKELTAVIDCESFTIPPVFQWLQRWSPVRPLEMFRTFNCGIGMVAVVKAVHLSSVVKHLKAEKIDAKPIGRLFERVAIGGGKVRPPLFLYILLLIVSSDAVRLLNAEHAFDGKVARSNDEEYLKRPRVNVGILISGTGSNMKRLIERSQERGCRCHVSVVISNKPDTAAEMGVETLVIPHGTDRTGFEAKVTKALEDRGVELICLAGFMRILTGEFVNHWRNRVINLHPSLLPAFKGAHAVKLALEAGVKITGCTAHFVVEDVDAGQILAQEAIRIDPQDDEDRLHEKIQRKEHEMYPKVMEEVARQLLEAKK
ncbi:Trifunctional purine biosynthetic protein adenosine-3 [Aphelenchoides fujianensis]|nr:Trifunctional purine biosynthetic protein adenosine-3 [Aphelenchoides fujianensis]